MTSTRSGVKLGTVAADPSSMRDCASKGSKPQRRREPRLPCMVSVLLQAGDVCGHGHLADLTPGGVRVQSALRPERGDTVRIRFGTPEGRNVELTGGVVWSAGVEFGVRIDQMDQGYLSFVETLSSLD